MEEGLKEKKLLTGRLAKAAPWLLSTTLAALFVLAVIPGLLDLRSTVDNTGAQGPAHSLPTKQAPGLQKLFDRVQDGEGTGSATPELLPPESDASMFSALAPTREPAVEPKTLGQESSSNLDCIIEPLQVVAIGSPVKGLIETLGVERSDLIESGQILVELESEAEKAAVKVARARAKMDGEVRSRAASLKLGERRQQRAKKLFEEEALSLDLWEEVDTEAALARLELKQARESQRLAALQLEHALANLNRRTIRSPISGIVVERLMSPGEVVDEQPILKVAQLDPLRVEVILPSAMFGSIKPGMWAAVEPEFPADEVHLALVTVVDRVIDAASGTFGVQLELRNPDHELPGGLHCQVRFLTE
jgi:RND family efflux transporter MFP subunit